MKRMPARIAAMTVAATLGIGGCGADPPPVCASLAAVQTTMHQIRNVNVAENGLPPLKAQLQQLRADVRQLLTDAGAQFAAEIAAVRAASEQVSESVAAARETPGVAGLASVRTALAQLQAGVRTLGDAMSGTC
ncbi:hypothetical protein [Pseudosporangium ferrugineum]|uniref:Lipoprotein n=1 Tax=Pseudosporangium ferrugineum TaxID=439699 RepID=A0A2T0SBY6_9ACTN|nr:hypothetical protein [Pseudosporangium ferrugineum]PRY30833.1 hypothetical protein CLV70_104385 [Pseudosporangium ferrugineum]